MAYKVLFDRDCDNVTERRFL